MIELYESMINAMEDSTRRSEQEHAVPAGTRRRQV